MNCVGIDVSKGKSTIAVMRPFGEVVVSPFEVCHTASELSELARLLKSLDGETRVVMESTGNYHAPVAWLLHGAGLYVSVVNAMLVHDYGNNSLRRGKTDKKDAVKLANYGLDHWLTLPRYVPEEDARLMLKTCYLQYQQYSKVQTMLKNNLISLLDTAFPDANRLFTSPPRADGSEKWVDFVAAFWHCECVCGLPYQMAVFAFEDLLEAKQWALDTQKGRRNLDKWELGKIALKLKPEIEAKAKANMSAGGGDQKSEDAKSGSAILPNPISAVDTRKELADSVGLGERTMGKVMQIDECAPAAVKEALDKKELSINQGYNLTRQLQEVPEEQREQAAIAAVEIEKAKKEIRQKDAEIDQRSRIAGLFCKVFEKAVLLEPTEENVRAWVECTRMNQEEMEDTVKEARELAETFSSIADIMEQKILPSQDRKEAV